MTTEPKWEAVPEIPRDYFGRPKVIPPDGGQPISYTRATTYVSCLEDTFNLGKWQMRMTARGLSIREDLLLRANSLGPLPEDDEVAAKRWKKDMDRLADQAVEAAKASASSNIGTALHSLAERLDRGQRVEDVPTQYRPHLKAYQAKTAGFTAVHIERFMVQDELQVGGTPDRILTIDGHPKLVIGDIKTGTLDFGIGKICMQLAMYAHSLLYDPATGERTSPGEVDQDHGIVIALDAKTGECTLKYVDLRAGWEAIQLATQVRAWRARKNLSRPYEAPIPPPTSSATFFDPTQALIDEATTTWTPPRKEPDATDELGIFRDIANAADTEALVALWQKHEAHWTPAMTDRAAARKAQLTN